MKINKRFLLLRIIILPIKVAFNIIWFVLIALMLSLKWLKNGGQELYYGDDFGGNIIELIDSNHALVEELNQKEKNEHSKS